MNNTRIPRPLGITGLGKQYNVTKDNEDYLRLEKAFIHSYIRNNFTLSGKVLSMEQFSNATQLAITKVYEQLGQYGKELNKSVGGFIDQDMLRVLQFSGFKNCLEGHTAIQQQLAILLQSQQNKYSPFITNAVNQALKLMVESNAQIISLIPKGNALQGPNALALNDDNQEYLTTDKAVLMFKSQGLTPLKEDPKSLAHLYTQYDIDNMPEVNAMRQEGVDNSKEGLAIKKLTDWVPNEDQEKDNHLTRREKEYDIDITQDQV